MTGTKEQLGPSLGVELALNSYATFEAQKALVRWQAMAGDPKEAGELGNSWKCDWPGCTLKELHGHAGLLPVVPLPPCLLPVWPGNPLLGQSLTKSPYSIE